MYVRKPQMLLLIENVGIDVEHARKKNDLLTNAIDNFSNGCVTVTLVRQHPVRYMAHSHGEEPHREVWQGRQETVL